MHRSDEPDDHALGRSRGGLTTKVHLACDGKGRSLAIMLTPGQRHDGICARPLLEWIRVPRAGLGRPRSRPDRVLADKAYSSRGFRALLPKRGIACTIPEKTDQQRHRHNRGHHGGRPRHSTGRSIAAATSSSGVSTASRASEASEASPPDTTRQPPPTKQRSVSRHSCSGQDPFEDGP
ncbi:transposase [Streptomyces longwoodensis]|uniref:transposase n=1 Tax=Streptomyces longwoodensis TaxID=68231 RepID=UPI003F577DBF